MKPSLWFVIPAAGRPELSAICFAQIADCAAQLRRAGLPATAVVIANDENLELARALGFWTVERDNMALGRKFNDGYELAAREGASHAMPCGSDDWVHPRYILSAPLSSKAIRCPREALMVAEDGKRAQRVRVGYDGGLGLRIVPLELLRKLGYRPAMEERNRAVDASQLVRLRRAHGGRLPLEYRDIGHWQIVDWKSPSENLNSYAACRAHAQGGELSDPWAYLEPHYPAPLLAAMREHYLNPPPAPAKPRATVRRGLPRGTPAQRRQRLHAA